MGRWRWRNTLSSPSRYGPGYFKSDSADTRSFLASPYARTLPPQYNSTFGMQDDNAMPLEYNNSHEEDAPSKRPRLLGDEQLDTPSSADSVSSGPIPFEGQITQDSTPSLPTSPPPVCLCVLACVLSSLYII